MANRVLIYNEECPYCSVSASVVSNINSDINVIDWNDNIAQEFLERQFNDVPFAMCLVNFDDETIYIGGDAASKIVTEDNGILSSVIKDNYDFVADTVNFLNNEEKDVDAYEGVFELTVSAINYREELLTNSVSPSTFEV